MERIRQTFFLTNHGVNRKQTFFQKIFLYPPITKLQMNWQLLLESNAPYLFFVYRPFQLQRYLSTLW